MSLPTEGIGDLAGPAADRAPGDERDGGSDARSSTPTVSVVLASRNRRHLLRRFVRAVAADPATAEVVVVLDGDVDGSAGELETLRRDFPTVRHLSADSVGQMAALDVGVQASTGDVVLLMDDDVIAGPGLVSAHALRHAGTHGLVVLGYMPVRLDEGSASPTRLYASEYEEHCRRLESGQLAVLEGLWLGNVSVRRDELLRVGVASTHFGVRWHADTDFGLRLGAAGLRGVFDRELAATHLHAQSAAQFLASARERGEGTWLLAHEHPDAPESVRPAPVLDGLSGPARAAVWLLGRDGMAGWTSRALMGVAAMADRRQRDGSAVRIAQMARRIQVAAGFRGEAHRARKNGRDGRESRPMGSSRVAGATGEGGAASGDPGAPPPDSAAYASSSTKSGR
ncbi:MAG TPA: glycosyltransferase [Acidimicrobiales bacterium]|nr:glycosyltransferase [Acidimicrobiales bacterium]